VKLIDKSNGYIFSSIDSSAVEFSKIAAAPLDWDYYRYPLLVLLVIFANKSFTACNFYVIFNGSNAHYQTTCQYGLSIRLSLQTMPLHAIKFCSNHVVTGSQVKPQEMAAKYGDLSAAYCFCVGLWNLE
jgi:hypothetical protein